MTEKTTDSKFILKNAHLSILAIVVLHAFALGGILSPWSEKFILLTPFHLCISMLLVLKKEEEGGNTILSGLINIAFVGFLIEIIGTNTDWIFGKYAFGKAFGPKIAGTPPLIGLVWGLFTFTAVQTSELVIKNKWIGATVAALLITGLNWMMEPLAPKLNFWFWDEGGSGAGWHDYIGSFIQGWIFSFYLYSKIKDVGNIVGLVFLVTQTVFFLLLRNLL